MNTTTEKELTVEITEAEYQEGLAKEWTNDDMLRPGKYKVRRATRFAKPEDLPVQNTTVTVHLAVTLDVLRHFEKLAEKLNSTSSEDLMKAELSAAMERDKQAEQAAIEKLLSNEKFIQAVAAKIAAQTSELKAA